LSSSIIAENLIAEVEPDVIAPARAASGAQPEFA
jgi:hypothetical protein